MKELQLSCHCGTVKGVIRNVEPGIGNRLVCYCPDCQDFARLCNRPEHTLNHAGGTDIYQTHPSVVEITQGIEHVACLRLSDKGLYRWYTSCCKTPIGNTVGAKLPFVGVIHSFFAANQDLDALIGPELGPVNTDSLTEPLPEELAKGKSHTRILLRVVSKLLTWKVLRKGRPNPFFQQDGKAIVKPRVIKAGETL